MQEGFSTVKSYPAGMLVTLNELGITIGFLLAFLVNYILMDTPGGWRVMFGLSSGKYTRVVLDTELARYLANNFAGYRMYRRAGRITGYPAK